MGGNIWAILGFHVTSLISVGVNSKSKYRHSSELNVHCMCLPQIRAISYHLLLTVQQKHQYS